jgi:hypothetical protein
VANVRKRNITTITVDRSTHFELYKLKRKLKKRSFDRLLRYLINVYYHYTARRGRRDPAQRNALQGREARSPGK